MAGRPGLPTPRAGDWHCPNTDCKNHSENFVYGSKPACPICGMPKPPPPPGGEMQHDPAAAAVAYAQQPAQVAMAVQYAQPAQMQQFQQMQQQMQQQIQPAQHVQPGQQFGARPGGMVPRMGDWHCPNPSCKNHTENVVFASKVQCPICGTAKHGIIHGTPGPQSWADYGGCGMPQQQQQPQQFGFNLASGQMTGCFPAGAYAAVAQRPGGMMAQRPPGGMERGVRRSQPGDWHCANESCKNFKDNFVYASKLVCPICGMDKPVTLDGENDGGFDAASQFNSTSRPGDWRCPNTACKNNINGVYGSKPSCSICGALNPNSTRERSRSPTMRF